MAVYYDSQAMATLISAVQEYKSNIETSYQVLVNAANVCDVAMGSDEFSARHIAELYEALKELKKVIEVVDNTLPILKRDKQIMDEM